MRADLLQLAADLARRGEAFALAMVVRRGAPTSSRVGDGALITQGGSFHGWLGGSCTQPTVVREALQALASGAPRLVTLTRDPAGERREGVTALPMTCESGGTVEIYIEPVLPPARLVVFGVSPVAQALVRLGKALGLQVLAADPDADRSVFPEADDVVTAADGGALRLRPGLRGPAVHAVVATMGRRDQDAVRAALELEPGYLGVVASRERFARLRETLLAGGVAPPALQRVRCPAGLDIGARRPEEIALSILAEIVQRRSAGPHGAAADAADPTPAGMIEEARDPVCGMTVGVAAARERAEHDGRTWYFCGAGCRARFEAEPARYEATGAEGAR